jgi:hypothetical protein
MRSRKVWELAFALIVAPSGLWAQQGTSRQGAAVIAFLDSTLALAQHHDTASLHRLADSGFAFVHSTGSVDDLPAFLTFASQGRQDSTRGLSPPRVRDFGAIAYVLTHTATWVPGRGWTAFRATDVVVRTPAGLRWAGHQSTALPATPVFIPLDQTLAAAVSGHYVSAQGVVRHVTSASDRLLVRTGDGPPVAYRALSATTFRAERGDAFLVFFRDAAVRVQYLEVLARAGAERYDRQGGS